MTDDEPPRFSVDEPERMGRIHSAYELAPFIWGPPVVVQTMLRSGQISVVTGRISATDDFMNSENYPEKSVIYFRDAEGVAIKWSEVAAVLAMVAVAQYEEENDGEPGGVGGGAPGEGGGAEG